MSTKRKIIDSLEKMCLKRVCLDITRHSAKYQAEANKESSEYLKFKRMYCHELLGVLYGKGEEILHPEKVSASAYIDCVDFIFNPYVERITLLPTIDFDEEITSAISRNCKKLRHLTITHRSLPPKLCVDFLKSLKSLVVLNLSQCSFENIPVMTAIADSLLHLKVLNLKKTHVDDSAVFVLCGHRRCRSNSISSCSFVKNCRTVSKLKLHSIVLDDTEITSTGLACVLNHIPTLKNIKVHCYGDNSLKLSNLIRDISNQRRTLRMSSIQFMLETLDFIDNLEALKACLEACPKLKDLCISFSNFEQEQMKAAGKVLEVNELVCVKTFSVQTTNVDSLYTEGFRNFWTKKGPQLQVLCLFNLDRNFHAEADVDVLFPILASCPSLSHLHLMNLFLVKNSGGKSFSCKLPLFQDLNVLCLEMDGDADLVSTTAGKLIHSASSVRNLCLGFTACEKFMLPYMSESYLPYLTELIVKGKETAEKFQDVSYMKQVTVKYLQA